MAFLPTLFLIALIIGGLLIAALLFRRDNRKANLLLCLILLLVLFYQYTQVGRAQDTVPAHPILWGIGFVISLVVPTLVYHYVLALTLPGFRWNRRLLLHFIPALVGLGIMVFAWTSLRGFAGDFVFRSWFRYFCNVFDVLVSGLFFYASYRQIRDYQSQMELFFSHLRHVRLQWLRILLLMAVVPWLIQVADVLTGPMIRFDQVMVPLITAIFLLIGFFGLRQSVIFTQDEEWPLSTGEKTVRIEVTGMGEKTPIYFSEEKLEEWRQKLDQFMAEKKPFLEPELRLGHLAAAIGLKSYQVSEILNRGIRSNFYDYINRHRVEEAKRRLRDPAFAHMNILGIATDSGFNSKSVFNETFRKFTGSTPSAFRSASLPD